MRLSEALYFLWFVAVGAYLLFLIIKICGWLTDLILKIFDKFTKKYDKHNI